ncbi:pentapeptide repeat-containing protein [Corynebacterium sp. CCM 9203]|uniref:pentapeptide repeat-containing protein n=1 Tax=Corynebacterium sp. CCM 9203 TaxID=3057615 RepID=UPI003523B8AF
MTTGEQSSAADSADDRDSTHRRITRGEYYLSWRNLLLGLPFLLLPAALIGNGWESIFDEMKQGWWWLLYAAAGLSLIVGLRTWLSTTIPVEADAQEASEEPGRSINGSELVFVLLALLSLAGGIRAVALNYSSGELAAGLFAGGGVALSVWATQRRSLEQQEREDKRQNRRLESESIRENERLEAESLRESRQLSVQQRLDLSQKLAVSIGHLAHDDVTVRAAAVSELIFQIDDWSSLERSERAVIEASADQQKEHKVKELESESLRRRQELFDLAFKSDIRGQSVLEVRTRGAGPRLVDGDRGCFAGVDLSGMVAPGVHAPEARLKGMKARGARLEGANLVGARLEGANLGRARLEGAYLGCARLERAHLREARLERANLWQARLERADLWGARLEGAYLVGARLEGAMLAYKNNDGTVTDPCTFDENTRWQGAFYSSSTVFPEGFDPQAHGMKLVDDPEPKEALEGGG